MSVIDQAAKTRQGEELDLARVEDFLKDNIPGLSGKVSISQFPSGYSNLTYLVSAGERQMVLRRPPHGTKAKSAHDMSREFRILSALHPVFPYCPRPLAYCDDDSVMGASFYVMERIEGIILRKQMPSELNFGPKQMEHLTKRLVELMAELHAVDYEAAGLGSFGKPSGYARRQVEGWSKRYRNARTPDVPDGEAVMAWLADNLPPDNAVGTIIHNDFKLDNVVLDPADPMRVIGVLDWEMATLGDPLMDLACTLAYWVQADDGPELLANAAMLTYLPGSLTRAQAVEYYGRKTGRVMDHIGFYYNYGLFRLAVIAQQIYYRFYHGQTRDQRFARMPKAVRALLAKTGRVMENASL
ncbi:MAG: phosphotransferase family protein [Desulfarculaceae bacterium]|nr:phosphotransferase family protein [Desulfarculaceae bacterium]MCF8071688.1 phosphotransferase family protein [Desulfarculaceae bacterium]MCF8102465.1 phosphotransferase family protein [Desulfarculaceae bacterium]MCF8116807.1 phosphotransferase family protein [Desulfarculaceae bacterium]